MGEGYAWVTLATNDSYSLGALVLAHSLKQVGTQQQLAVLITPGVTGPMRTKLGEVFNVVKEVNILDSKDEANLKLLKRPELGITFTKLHCWRLTQFEKCVFLDADTLVLENCDELFEREELSAAPDIGWPDCFNSGVFVYRPSYDTYDKLIQFALEKGSFDGGDQGLLNLYFSDWAHKDISKHLPFIYNMSSTAFYSYLPAFKQFGKNAKIIHFLGSSKPWLQYFNTETRTVRPSEGLNHLEQILQLWWNIFCNLIHSKLSTDMAGLAGAFANLTLGQARTPEQQSLDDHLRRQGWEVGNIDYLGKDSFDNIWSKICETLSEGTEKEASPPKHQDTPAEALIPEVTDKLQKVELVQTLAPDELAAAPEVLPSPAETPKTSASEVLPSLVKTSKTTESAVEPVILEQEVSKPIEDTLTKTTAATVPEPQLSTKQPVDQSLDAQSKALTDAKASVVSEHIEPVVPISPQPSITSVCTLKTEANLQDVEISKTETSPAAPENLIPTVPTTPQIPVEKPKPEAVTEEGCMSDSGAKSLDAESTVSIETHETTEPTIAEPSKLEVIASDPTEGPQDFQKSLQTTILEDPNVTKAAPVDISKALPLDAVQVAPVEVPKPLPVDTLQAVSEQISQASPVDPLKATQVIPENITKSPLAEELKTTQTTPIESPKSSSLVISKETPQGLPTLAPVEVSQSPPAEASQSLPVKGSQSPPVDSSQTPIIVQSSQSTPVKTSQSTPVETTQALSVEVSKESSADVLKQTPVEGKVPKEDSKGKKSDEIVQPPTAVTEPTPPITPSTPPIPKEATVSKTPSSPLPKSLGIDTSVPDTPPPTVPEAAAVAGPTPPPRKSSGTPKKSGGKKK